MLTASSNPPYHRSTVKYHVANLCHRPQISASWRHWGGGCLFVKLSSVETNIRGLLLSLLVLLCTAGDVSLILTSLHSGVSTANILTKMRLRHHDFPKTAISIVPHLRCGIHHPRYLTYNLSPMVLHFFRAYGTAVSVITSSLLPPS